MNTIMHYQLSSYNSSRTITLLETTRTKLRFSRVYKDHRDSIYTFVLFRVGHDGDVAEDVVSDVFLKAYRNYSSYDPKYAITTWLYTIARNTLIDHYRKGRVVVDIDDLPVADEDDALYRLVNEEINEREVEEEIAALPEVQQRAIRGQFFEGKNAKEMAEELGLSHAATRKQVSRGIATLRKSLLVALIFISDLIVFVI